jgi:hypothetical protein
MSNGESGSRFGQTRTQEIIGPGPCRRLVGRGTEARGLLIGQVGDGGGDKDSQVGRNGSMLNLQLFGGALALAVMDLVVHPATEEHFLVTGQSHLGVLVRHRCSS